MDVERVLFSVGQQGAVDAFEKALTLRVWAAHVGFFGDHLPATVFTSDTPKRLTARDKVAIEDAVVDKGKHLYLDRLTPVYGSRMSRQIGRYFMSMARDALPTPAVPAYIPALIT